MWSYLNDILGSNSFFLKYELDHLKRICERSLSSTLANETVVGALLLADMHNSTQLKTRCIDYITSNSVAVRQTDHWKQLAQKRPDLVVELFQAMSDKMDALVNKSGLG